MSIPTKNFAGIGGFVWFFGIVEDRQDPLGLGRVRVRVYSLHSEGLTDIPTEDLPWASVIQSPNDRTFSTPREADMVFGFFTDGMDGQQPVIIGVVPGYFSQSSSSGGFQDMRNAAILKNAPRKPTGRTYSADGTGIKLAEANSAQLHPNADELEKTSITGVSAYRNLANTVIEARKNNLDKDVQTATGNTWSEPYPAYSPRYPYNQVNETESGHLFEMDDSPGAERVHIAHRSGSYIEWFPTGTRVEKVVKSKYSTTLGDDHVHIVGKCLITVDGDAEIRVEGNTVIHAGNDLNANVSGDMKLSVGGALDIKAASVNFDVTGEFAAVSATQKLTSSGSMDVKGSTVKVGGSTVDIGGTVKIENLGTFIPSTGYSSQVNIPVSAASGGTATGISAPDGRGTATTASPPAEKIPVPPDTNLVEFDPETAQAYKEEGFLVDSEGAHGGDPGSNATRVARETALAGPCKFDVQGKTFLSDSKQWAISSSGLSFIKGNEGFVATAYHDPAFSKTTFAIGYGTSSAVAGVTITEGMVVSKETATGYLLNYVNICTQVLKQTIKVPLTQNMIDACLDLMYNIGTTNFRSSVLVDKINAQAWCDAGYQFLVWNTTRGIRYKPLVTRRNADRNLFLS